jgi:hypothetical protein
VFFPEDYTLNFMLITFLSSRVYESIIFVPLAGCRRRSAMEMDGVAPVNVDVEQEAAIKRLVPLYKQAYPIFPQGKQYASFHLSVFALGNDIASMCALPAVSWQGTCTLRGMSSSRKGTLP